MLAVVAAAGLDVRDGALKVLAQARGLALGGLGAGAADLGVLAGLLDLRGQRLGHALEVVDALHRRQQARHHGGGVVEVVDGLALDARIRVGDALLSVGVGLGAGGLALGELLLDPGRRLQRAEHDQRAGGAPALPRLRLDLDRRRAARARRPGAAGACAAASGSAAARSPRSSRNSEKSKPSSSLTGTNTASIGKVPPSRRRAVHLDAAGRGGRVAGGEEAPPLLRVGRQRAGHERVEERTGRAPPARARPNSSSAGSDHLETDPWPSVRTK